MFMINKETDKKIPLSVSELSVENKEPRIVTNLSSEPHIVTFGNMYVDWVTFYETWFGIQLRWYQKIYLRLLCRWFFFKTRLVKGKEGKI